MKLTTTLFAVTALSAATSFAAGKPDFAKDIGPILAKNFIECHGPEKQKGKLRLDSKETAFKGGDSGLAGVVPGKSADSALVKAVARLVEDDAMPPEGKGKPLTAEQIGLIRAWIDQGAK